jgi:DNA polymerase I-like protein with 3'-5' exonuclease and polymerase domains
LVFEVPTNEVAKVSKFIATEMNNVYELKVPIKTEVSFGDNWDEQEELE